MTLRNDCQKTTNISLIELITTTPSGSTPLHQAALFGLDILVRKLLYRKGLSPIEALAIKKLPKPAEMLTARDSSHNLPLDRAAPRGHDKVVKILVTASKEFKADYPSTIPNKENYTPLLSAIRWYFRVLDKSYARETLVGKFNVINPDEAFNDIITTLLKHYPLWAKDSKYRVDDKNCNALYYLIRIISSNQDKSETSRNICFQASNLIEKLLLAGMPLDLDHCQTSSMTPRQLAKLLDKDILHLVESLEKKALATLAEEKTEDKHEEKIEDKRGEKTEYQRGEKAEYQREEKTEDKRGEKTESKHGEKAKYKRGEKTKYMYGEKTESKREKKVLLEDSRTLFSVSLVNTPQCLKKTIKITRTTHRVTEFFAPANSLDCKVPSELSASSKDKVASLVAETITIIVDAKIGKLAINPQNKSDIMARIQRAFAAHTIPIHEMSSLRQVLNRNLEIEKTYEGICCWRRPQFILKIDSEFEHELNIAIKNNKKSKI